MVLYINCAIHAPGVKFGQVPEVDVSINLLWEKNSKIFFSETTGPTALIFCMWQWLMVLYINCANHVPGVKFGHAPGVDSLHRPTIGKTKKIFFSETTRPTALIFCMWQWLMVLYINCASHAPGVKFGHAPGVDSLHRLTMGKTKKNFFSETKRPRASIFCMQQCLVVPIIDCASHAPGSNLAMPRGSIVSMHRLSLVDSQLI